MQRSTKGLEMCSFSRGSLNRFFPYISYWVEVFCSFFRGVRYVGIRYTGAKSPTHDVPPGFKTFTLLGKFRKRAKDLGNLS